MVTIGAAFSGSISQRRSLRKRGRSVAILPIGHEGGGSEEEYLMDGITESIINSLSQLPKLKVTARSTAFRYKGKDVDPREVGKTLGVEMLMTGRGIRHGDRLDIQAELVNAEDGSQVWGQHFSTNLSDIFSVQEEIAGLISAALQKKLTGAEKRLLGKRYTQNVEAYQFYLKGRYYWNRRTPEALEKAITLFEQAIAADPTYALAYSGIADCYNFLGWDPYGISDPKITCPRAIAAATRALEIDENLAEAYNSLAWAKWSFNRDWHGAERDYRRSIKLNPGYALARVWYADLLAGAGQLDQALKEIQIAENLDPLAPIVYSVHALILYFIRNYSGSRAEAGKALELQPDFLAALLITGRDLEFEGKYPEAMNALDSAAVRSGNHPRMRAFQAHAYASSGRSQDARKILDELVALSKQQYIPALVDMALVYTALGEIDLAFEWLEMAFEERAGLLVWLYPDPAADPLRSDPRFDDLMRRISLTGYQNRNQQK
jgi:TolB-like protein/Tfp pilus assembly protein PilF